MYYICNMRICLFILGLSWLFFITTSSAQSPAVKGLYVDRFATILGNSSSEDSLLQYAQNGQYTYLALYDLGPVHLAHNLTTVGTSAVLANFIQKAKQIYNIDQVGAIGENFSFFNTVINIYNQIHTNPLQKFDVYNVEFEFWNTTQVSPGNYYCVNYLAPASLSCDTAGAFAYYRKLIHQVDSLANATGVISETYVGLFNAGQAVVIANTVDRILLHDYINNYSSLYTYVRTRLQYIAGRNVITNVIPIFSAEPGFMGPWLSTHTLIQPYNDLYADLAAETGTWKAYINLLGYQWFDYSYMPPIVTNSADQQTNLNDNVRIFPNPASSAINISIPKNKGICSVTITNPLGQVVYYREDKNPSFAIDVSGLPVGIYFCRMKINGTEINKKIMVAR